MIFSIVFDRGCAGGMRSNIDGFIGALEAADLIRLGTDLRVHKRLRRARLAAHLRHLRGLRRVRVLLRARDLRQVRHVGSGAGCCRAWEGLAAV